MKNKVLALREKDKEMCQLEGPYECPSCGGHMMLDSTYLEQVSNTINCPYCNEACEVKDSEEADELVITK